MLVCLAKAVLCYFITGLDWFVLIGKKRWLQFYWRYCMSGAEIAVKCVPMCTIGLTHCECLAITTCLGMFFGIHSTVSFICKLLNNKYSSTGTD